MGFYDASGSHTTSSVDAGETTYAANNLNQYSQISVPSVPSVDNPAYDLVASFPLGLFTGLCCPCPEHQPKYGASTVTLLSASSKLALWADACKSNAFMGTIHAGWAVYVGGLAKSTTVDAEELLWEYTQGNETHVFTNVFTLLSQRIFADLDSDGDVDADDNALHSSLSSEFGWILPVATNAFRKAQLRADVGISGIHTLTLSGDSCRVWQTGTPSTNDAPLQAN